MSTLTVAVNGCASVVATPAATLITMQLGGAVEVIAVDLYPAAALALGPPSAARRAHLTRQRTPQPEARA